MRFRGLKVGSPTPTTTTCCTDAANSRSPFSTEFSSRSPFRGTKGRDHYNVAKHRRLEDRNVGVERGIPEDWANAGPQFSFVFM